MFSTNRVPDGGYRYGRRGRALPGRPGPCPECPRRDRLRQEPRRQGRSLWLRLEPRQARSRAGQRHSMPVPPPAVRTARCWRGSRTAGGALAIDRYGRAQGKSALSQKRAEERAMRACKSGEDAGCAIVEAVCVEPGKQARTWSGSDSVLAMPAAASRPAAAEEARDAALTRADRIGVQRGLAALGFDAGLADGMFGPRTRSAIQAWQKAKGLVATGTLTRDEAQAIAAATAESEEEPAPGETPGPGSGGRAAPAEMQGDGRGIEMLEGSFPTARLPCLGY